MRYTIADAKSFIADYKKSDGNTSRNLLRKFVCDIKDDIMSSELQQKIEQLSGMNFRRYVESVDRCVLLQMVLDAMTKATNEDTYLKPLSEPSNYCHPKRRGGGFSFGFSKTISPDDFRIVQMIEAEMPDIGNALMPMPSVVDISTAITLTEHKYKIECGLLSEDDPVDLTVTDVTITDACNLLWASGKFVNPDDTNAYTTGVISYIRTQTNEDGSNKCEDTYDYVTDHRSSDVMAIMDIIKPSNSNDETDPVLEQGLVTALDESKFDPTQLQAINVLTKNANKDGLSLSDILGKLANTEKELAQAKTIKATIASTPSVPQATQGEVDDLTYEIVMQQASKIFGKSVKAMKFDIPTLVWKNKQGSVVQHPMTPEIDPTYEFRPQHLIKFLTAHLFGQNLWLHGHTGTGKTTLAEQIASRIGYPVFRLNLDSNMERADIVGSKEIVVENGQPTTKFFEGILPRAMQLPCFLILDEMDAGMPDILFSVQRALEKKGLVLTEDGGRLVQSHSAFRFIATANSRGQGDEFGWYQGVRPMNLATLDRFGTFIEVGYLAKDQETRVLSKSFPQMAKDKVEQVVQFTKEIREAFVGGELSTTISPRGSVALCQYFLHMKDLMPDENSAMKSAVEAVITDRAPMDSKQRVVEIAQRCFQ